MPPCHTRCHPVTLRWTRGQLYNHHIISAKRGWFELFMKPIKEERSIHSLSFAKGTSKKSCIDRCLMFIITASRILGSSSRMWSVAGSSVLYTQYFIWTCCPTFNKCNNYDELQLVSQLKLLLKTALLHSVLYWRFRPSSLKLTRGQFVTKLHLF